MSMSRKNYKMVADAVVTELRFSTTDTEREHIARLARTMAEQFRSDNPRFRFDLFYEAAGLDAWGELRRMSDATTTKASA